MKIAVIGSGVEENPDIAEKARELGKLISKKATLIFGGCKGYPYEAAKSAKENGGEVVAFSPAKDIDEHKQKYNFPDDAHTEIVFTGFGIPERNIPLIKASDAVIMISGQIGTLNEFTLAYHLKKPVGVLMSGGLTEVIPKISEICDKAGEKNSVFYSEKPEELVELLLK